MSDQVKPQDYEDVTKFGLTAGREAELLTRQTECTFIWSNSSGHPVGVIMNFIFRDGRFWLTAAEQRKRIAAIRRDPRVSIAISSRGSGITTRQSLTYKGRCEIHTDDETKAWFYPAFVATLRPGNPAAQQAFLQHLDSPHRVILEVVPEGRIGFDSEQMFAGSAAAPSPDPPSREDDQVPPG